MEVVLHVYTVRQNNMNWTPYIAIWSFFAAIVLALAAYRKMLSNREDDSIHVSEGGSRLIPAQVANAQRIEVIEKWGKSLTAVVVFAGLVMAAVYFYGVWQSSSGNAIVQ
jgi:cyanate permease